MKTDLLGYLSNKWSHKFFLSISAQLFDIRTKNFITSSFVQYLLWRYLCIIFDNAVHYCRKWISSAVLNLSFRMGYINSYDILCWGATILVQNFKRTLLVYRNLGNFFLSYYVSMMKFFFTLLIINRILNKQTLTRKVKVGLHRKLILPGINYGRNMLMWYLGSIFRFP